MEQQDHGPKIDAAGPLAKVSRKFALPGHFRSCRQAVRNRSGRRSSWNQRAPGRGWLRAVGSHGIRCEKAATKETTTVLLMIRTPNIQSLTEFQRGTKATLALLKKTGDPLVLTVNGRAKAVLQDAAAYQKMLDRIDYLETLEALRKSMKDVEAGRTIPWAEAVKQIRSRRYPRHRG
jgi:PHD/YefM family antitoxin component YafN of YafNO toxin-antitoxin module